MARGLHDARQRTRRLCARGHRDAGQARHVHRDGEDVLQVHLDRIARALLADAEGGRRSRGRQHRVDALREAVLKVLLDQRADLLGAQVIGVVVAGRQHVSADHDAAADLLAEAAGPRVLVHADDVAAGDALPIAHTVIAREVRRSLRGRHDVIGRQRVFGVRQADLDDLAAGVLQPGDAVLPELLDLGRHAVEAILW